MGNFNNYFTMGKGIVSQLYQKQILIFVKISCFYNFIITIISIITYLIKIMLLYASLTFIDIIYRLLFILIIHIIS